MELQEIINHIGGVWVHENLQCSDVVNTGMCPSQKAKITCLSYVSGQFRVQVKCLIFGHTYEYFESPESFRNAMLKLKRWR